jgi:MerR family transcriptional regulator, light-induced transcriptional regulator
VVITVTRPLQHSIRVVARRTGLSPHVIRVWEKRYATVKPDRSGGNQRLYSEADVQRLALLKRATEAGHGIGTISHLSVGQLNHLLLQADSGSEAARPRRVTRRAATRSAADFLDAAFETVRQMDGAALERVLDEASVAHGQIALLSHVIAPLVTRIGCAWRAGELKVAHEHIASAAIRTYLGQAARPHAVHEAAPLLLATTPAGQFHELGASLVAATAASHGWRVTYAGASLPAEEIVAATLQQRARAVALSIVHPSDDPLLAGELRRLRRLLPAKVPLIFGGRAAGDYATVITEIGGRLAASLDELNAVLEELRQSAN